jgi:4'-phosphopantetheinyl transferase
MKPNEAHLWCAFPDEIRDDALLSRYRELMSPDEEKRHRRFHFEKHRRQYLVSRALVRTTLSRYTGIAPKDLLFAANAHGRPEIEVDPPCEPPIRFNLSHTDGLILFAVVLKSDIGVDVEDMDRRAVAAALADRYFSAREAEALRKLPENSRKARFFDYWTLKESYIKARGMGLSIPLDRFSFHMEGEEGIRISFDPRLRDVPEDWQFWLLSPTRRHTAALSIRRGSGMLYRLSIQKVVPLRGEEDLPVTIRRVSRGAGEQ